MALMMFIASDRLGHGPCDLSRFGSTLPKEETMNRGMFAIVSASALVVGIHAAPAYAQHGNGGSHASQGSTHAASTHGSSAHSTTTHGPATQHGPSAASH